ncbi:MAG: NCS2 family permease [Rikenellaceae bacterium]
MLKQLLGFDKKQHDLRTEIVAGVTTFLTMAYILIVNPMVMYDAGMDQSVAFTATALASALGTMLVAFIAKMPLAQAPGMGINTFFAYTLVGAMGYTWQTALTVTFVEGLFFIFITVLNIREKFISAIPSTLRTAMSVGIGFFIAFIGLQSSGIIVGNEATLVRLADFNPSNLLAIFGIFACGIMLHLKIKGALFLGVVLTTVLSFVCGVSTMPANFSPVALPSSIESVLFQFDFRSLMSLELIIVIFTVAFVDIFDTMATLIGVSISGGFVEDDGKITRAKQVLLSDAIATTAGSMLGATTVTTYVESLSGIAAGGKSGLTAFVVGALFLLSLIFAPLFMLVPSIATAGVLVMVGVLMLSGVKKIDTPNIAESLPAFLTIIVMLLSYSLSEGIAAGMISYVVFRLFTPERRELTTVQVVVAAAFVLRYIIK